MQSYNRSKGMFRTICQKIPNLQSERPELLKMQFPTNDAQNAATNNATTHNSMLFEADPAAANRFRWTGSRRSNLVQIVPTAQHRRGREESIRPLYTPSEQSYPNSINPAFGYNQWNGATSRNGFWRGAMSNPFQDPRVESAYSVHRNLSYRTLDANRFSNVKFRRNDNGGQRRSSTDSGPNIDVKSVAELRMWEQVEETKDTADFVFRLMSYNVLAQNLLEEHPELYQQNCQRALNWSVRWKNLLREITKANPDILCMQEVQESHIPEHYRKLNKQGYEGLFKRRTGGNLMDGCAIYYKTDILNLVEYTTVEYFQPNVNVLDRHNVAIIAKFSPKDNQNEQFVVATTHLLYNPKREDVRLAQVQILLTEIERFAFKTISTGDTHEYLPVLITGDFNTRPESSVYEFLSKSHLEYHRLSPRTLEKGGLSTMGKHLVPRSLGITDNCQHAALAESRKKNLPANREEEMSIIRLHHSAHSQKRKDVETRCSVPMLHGSGILRHPFRLNSVYKHFLNGQPEGTTFQDRWITVDYIFYSGLRGNGEKEGKLQLLERYTLPTKDQLDKIRIPNLELGSDHLALLATFKLQKQK